METKELLYIQSLIKDLSSQIKSLAKNKDVQQTSYESPIIKDLAGALSKAQGEFKVAGLNKKNPYFKSSYADLASIVAASRSALVKNNLCVTQQIVQEGDGGSLLITKLHHASGQWILSKSRIVPPKTDIQSISSYITYLKRINYASLIGVVAGDEDDDGEMAVADTRQLFAKGPANKINKQHYSTKEESFIEVITKEQLESLTYELEDEAEIAEKVLDGLKIQSLADIPKNKYMATIKRIREIKTNI